jgi:hypothetical protein
MLTWILALAGCTLDPDAPTDAAELRVSVVGIAPGARHLTVSIFQGGASVASFRPAVAGDALDVWFTEIPLGALDLLVATDAGQSCERVLINRSGLQQEVVDLAGECDQAGPADMGRGGQDGGGGGGGEGAEDGHEDDREEEDERA